ncbi:YeiH family protein [Sphingobium agri]|uniref:Sulfate exporter family transporter n=1 Tax=Sphingobium agri TaxID=2933566 RepID=A0ABT0DZM7_9SPHN|nr:putative sulfate exporter family transporter [Sphingobium agri]MCK0532575.1 putative sulfate exporter family transporter [Sphingobium agri]
MRAMIGADLYCDVPPLKRSRGRDFAPGLVIVALGTLAAGFMADHYGAPLTLMALLLGLSLNFLSSDVRLQPGLNFAARSLLRWGIVLAGTRVTMGEIAGLGPVALVSIAAIVAITIAAGICAARLAGYDTPFGLLAGGSVAICGGSAAMALATTLGPKRVNDAQLTLVLVGISAMSAGAMVLYPIAAHLLHLPDINAGFLLGASIHDVAQALGAGYAYSDGAGQIAAIVKLTRVALLAPVLAIVPLIVRREGASGGGTPFPWFVAGFFLLAAVNSTGIIPSAMSVLSAKAATALLAAAVTATAIRSPLPKLMEAGVKPLMVIVAATVMAFMLSLAVALLLIG